MVRVSFRMLPWLVIISILCVFNPIGRSYGFELPALSLSTPQDTKSREMGVSHAIVVTSNSINYLALFSIKNALHCPRIDDGWKAATVFSVRRDDEFCELLRALVVGVFVGKRIRENVRDNNQLSQKSWTVAHISEGPFYYTSEPKARVMSIGQAPVINLKHNPGPLACLKNLSLPTGSFGSSFSNAHTIRSNDDLFFDSVESSLRSSGLAINVIKSFVGDITLSVNSQPLSPSEQRVDDTDDKQANINQHRWRVPGFFIGAALFISGFVLLGYGAKCFDHLSLKLRGFLWLLIGGFLNVLGGALIFVGPYLL